MASNSPTFAARVRALTGLGPGMSRVTLEFLDGAPRPSERHSAGHCRLVFSEDETRTRDFTYRRWHPEGAVDIDFALHGGRGPAARWISKAQPGSVLGLRRGGPPTLKCAPRSGRLVMVADAAGIPVVCALLDRHHGDATVLVHAAPTNFDQHLSARGRCFGTEDEVFRAVCGAELTPKDTLFVACEASLMCRLRRHALDDRALPADRVLTSGYWKRGHTTEAVDSLKQGPRRFGDSPAGRQSAGRLRCEIEEALMGGLDGAASLDEGILEQLWDRSRDNRIREQDDNGK